MRERALKREKRLTDRWSYDGRIVVKDNDSRITTVTSEADLAAVCPSNAARAGEEEEEEEEEEVTLFVNGMVTVGAV